MAMYLTGFSAVGRRCRRGDNFPPSSSPSELSVGYICEGYVVDRTYKDTESVPRLAPARGLLLLRKKSSSTEKKAKRRTGAYMSIRWKRTAYPKLNQKRQEKKETSQMLR
eukprot:1380880-Amorphochlora_amoeboformis.AAC.1